MATATLRAEKDKPSTHLRIVSCKRVYNVSTDVNLDEAEQTVGMFDTRAEAVAYADEHDDFHVLYVTEFGVYEDGTLSDVSRDLPGEWVHL